MFDIKLSDPTVIKLNKRLYVRNGDGSLIYTPPDFIRFKVNRDLMKNLIDSMMEVGYIKAVIKFESDRRKVRKKF